MRMGMVGNAVVFSLKSLLRVFNVSAISGHD
jgi:hypothetical protein